MNTRVSYINSFCIVVAGVFFLMLAPGCGSNPEDLFTPIEITPPKQIADSLYTETPSGLRYYDLLVGTGSLAEAGYAAEHHYTMWLSDSTLVRSSYLSGLPQVVVLGEGDLIPGWEEGLDGMRAGGYRQLKIPPDLAYGETGVQSLGIPPNETIFMELQLTRVGIQTGKTGS